jgi:hypothetical protein
MRVRQPIRVTTGRLPAMRTVLTRPHRRLTGWPLTNPRLPGRRGTNLRLPGRWGTNLRLPG